MKNGVFNNYTYIKLRVVNFLGFASTPSTDNITEIYESISSINHLHLHYDAIKQTLQELNKFTSIKGECRIPDELQWHSVSRENLKDVFKDASEMEINIGLLWAAFLNRSDLFEGFLEIGGQLR